MCGLWPQQCYTGESLLHMLSLVTFLFDDESIIIEQSNSYTTMGISIIWFSEHHQIQVEWSAHLPDTLLTLVVRFLLSKLLIKAIILKGLSIQPLSFFLVAQWYDDQMTTKGIPHSEYIMSIQSRLVSALSDLFHLCLENAGIKWWKRC
jgi:hypothetical protein